MSFLGHIFSTKSRELTDLELLQSYQQTGNLQQLGSLYDRYMVLVYGVCLRYLKNEEDSQDLVMQLFEKLSQKLKKTEQPIANFQAWLYQVAKNECLMWLRKQQQHKEIAVSTLLPSSSNQEDDLDGDRFWQLVGAITEEFDNFGEFDKEQDLVLLEQMIEKLAEEQKICIKLFYLQEKCYKEIVTLTGYDLQKVKSYIQNGKRNLKLLMGK